MLFAPPFIDISSYAPVLNSKFIPVAYAIQWESWCRTQSMHFHAAKIRCLDTVF